MGKLEDIYKISELAKKGAEEQKKKIAEEEDIRVCNRLRSTIKEVTSEIVDKLESNPTVVDHGYKFIKYNSKECLAFIVITHHSSLYWENIVGYTYLTSNGQLLICISGHYFSHKKTTEGIEEINLLELDKYELRDILDGIISLANACGINTLDSWKFDGNKFKFYYDN